MFSTTYRKVTLAFAMVCVLTGAAALARQNRPGGPVASNLWPLKKGNTWTMPTTVVNTATNDKKSVTQELVVAETMKTAKGEEAKVEYHIGDKLTQVETYLTDANGVWRTGGGLDGNGKITPPIPLIKYPLKVGNRWSWKGVITLPQGVSNGSGEYSVPETKSLKLMGQTMLAYRVSLKMKMTQGGASNSLVNDYWFVPNVGLVKQTMTIGTLTVDGALSKYTLAK